MALTLVDQVKQRLPGTEFIFAIDPTSFNQERYWAEYYGLRIIRGDNCVSHFFNTNTLLRVARFLYRKIMRKPISLKSKKDFNELHKEFMQCYQDCDLIISMRGISYVGDGTKGRFEGLLSYSDLYYAKKSKKPFAHFVQSFGPFNDWKVRYFARKDFAYVDFIPARGKESAKYCQQIVRHPEKIYDFPDIAILLPIAEDAWTFDYLHHLGLQEGQYIILSPSSVIYHLPPEVEGSIGEEHAQSFYLIARDLLSHGENILFLAHMYSDDKKQCDREVSRRVIQRLEKSGQNLSRCKLVEEDLNPWQAKSLIAKSKLIVASRYHAIVAAVSTSTPVIALGWNVKYRDILDYYGIPSMAIDVRKKSPEEIRAFVFDKFKEYREKDYAGFLKERQGENIKKVESAFDLLTEWIRNNVESPRN
jgi:polysaccharide pyruvyl transferase WcaK-like protein